MIRSGSSPNVGIPQIQQYEIRAVNTSFNNIKYALQGRVALRWGDSTTIRSLRLDTLSPNDDIKPAFSEILVFFEGGWRKACSGIEKNDILRIENSKVALSNNADLHPFKLVVSEDERHDDLRLVVYRKHQQDASNSRVASPSLLPGYARVLVVTKMNLDDGVVMQHHFPHTVSEPPRDVGFGLGARGRNRRTRRPRPNYHYSSIGDLWKEFIEGDERPEVKKRVNVYGVLVNGRGPSTCSGPDLRSEIVLIDPSSVDMMSDGEPVVLRVHKFHKRPEDSLPFRAVGDIVRAHRVDVRKFIDLRTGTTMLQAQSQKWSSFVLWDVGSDPLDPLRPCGSISAQANDSATSQKPVRHTLTNEDYETVRYLQKWSRQYLSKTNLLPGLRAGRKLETGHSLSSTSMVRTVREITDPHFHPSGTQEDFDLVGFFEMDGNRGHEAHHIQFTLCGSQDDSRGQKILVQSESPTNGRPSFMSYAISWTFRPCIERGWICIRDPCVEKRNGLPSIILKSSRQTSTLLWLREDLPQVRLAIQRELQAGRGKEAMQWGGSRPMLNGDACQLQRDLRHIRQRGTHQKYVVITAHSNKYKETMPIRRIYRLANMSKMPSAFRIRARARGIIEPNDVRLACRPWCSSCESYLDFSAAAEDISEGNVQTKLPPSLVCDVCGKNYSGLDDAKLEWAYLLRILLENDDEHMLSRAEGVIEGHEGNLFFFNTPPGNLFSNKERRRKIVQYLRGLLHPGNVVDCCVRPFTYISTTTKSQHLALKIFGTRLVPERCKKNA